MDNIKIVVQDPIAVANYVINYAKCNELHNVTNLQLQKILFFLQGYVLKKYRQPLMSGKFTKWKYGPVQSKVYQAFKYNGSSPIKSLCAETYFKGEKFMTIEPMMDDKVLTNSQQFNKLIKSLIEIPVWNLITMTHQHQSWSKFKKQIMSYANLEYNNKEIRSCFEANAKNFEQ